MAFPQHSGLPVWRPSFMHSFISIYLIHSCIHSFHVIHLFINFLPSFLLFRPSFLPSFIQPWSHEPTSFISFMNFMSVGMKRCYSARWSSSGAAERADLQAVLHVPAHTRVHAIHTHAHACTCSHTHAHVLHIYTHIYIYISIASNYDDVGCTVSMTRC